MNGGFPLSGTWEDAKREIVRRFVRAVEHQDLPPEGTARSLLIDHVPLFLDELSAELAEPRAVGESQDATDESPTARRHGDQRWILGYDLQALIREYGILRHCIVTTLRDAGGSLSMDEFDKLAKCLNVAVAEAAAAYVRHHDEQLQRERQNWEFLAEVSQALAASLEYSTTLHRLTRAIVPRLADACVIHLDESAGTEVASTVAHADPAKEELLRELYEKAAASRSEPFASRAQPLQTTLVSNAQDAQAPLDAHRELLDRLGVRSWMAVPLAVQGNHLGAMVLYYADSPRQYTPSAVILVEELARRAAAAIENARLYATSQAERARVEEATRAKDQFVAMISHELRTPLNAVLGWTRMLRGGVLAPEKRQHALEVIERNTLSQNQLIDDLLDISRIISGNMRVNRVEIDFGAVVELAVESVRPVAENKGIHTTVQVDPALPLVFADRERMRQVVLNLLTNAIKFTDRGGRIEVRLGRAGAALTLSVADTGMGITPEFLPHVFEHFKQSQAGTTRAQRGLGIGLAIVRHLVELHGGAVRADSPGPGRGAVFTVRLPVERRPGAMQSPSRPPPALEADALSGLGGLSVLVVDDEHDTRELLATVLETAGMTVVTAPTVAEALRQLDLTPVDVLVSDIGMPGEDGHALIRAIRAGAIARPELPALALTAYAQNEDRLRALSAGFSGYMTKPVEPGELLRTLADLAESAGLRRNPS